MPDGLSLADQWFFQGLAYLYARFRSGQISREQGSKEKGAMLYQHDKAVRNEQFEGKMISWHVALTKDIEAAQNAYRKSRTLENADRLSAALDGRLREWS